MLLKEYNWKHVVIFILILAIIYFLFENSGIKSAFHSLSIDLGLVDDNKNKRIKNIKEKHGRTPDEIAEKAKAIDEAISLAPGSNPPEPPIDEIDNYSSAGKWYIIGALGGIGVIGGMIGGGVQYKKYKKSKYLSKQSYEERVKFTETQDAMHNEYLRYNSYRWQNIDPPMEMVDKILLYHRELMLKPADEWNGVELEWLKNTPIETSDKLGMYQKYNDLDGNKPLGDLSNAEQDKIIDERKSFVAEAGQHSQDSVMKKQLKELEGRWENMSRTARQMHIQMVKRKLIKGTPWDPELIGVPYNSLTETEKKLVTGLGYDHMTWDGIQSNIIQHRTDLILNRALTPDEKLMTIEQIESIIGISSKPPFYSEMETYFNKVNAAKGESMKSFDEWKQLWDRSVYQRRRNIIYEKLKSDLYNKSKLNIEDADTNVNFAEEMGNNKLADKFFSISNFNDIPVEVQTIAIDNKMLAASPGTKSWSSREGWTKMYQDLNNPTRISNPDDEVINSFIGSNTVPELIENLEPAHEFTVGVNPAQAEVPRTSEGQFLGLRESRWESSWASPDKKLQLEEWIPAVNEDTYINHMKQIEGLGGSNLLSLDDIPSLDPPVRGPGRGVRYATLPTEFRDHMSGKGPEKAYTQFFSDAIPEPNIMFTDDYIQVGSDTEKVFTGDTGRWIDPTTSPYWMAEGDLRTTRTYAQKYAEFGGEDQPEFPDEKISMPSDGGGLPVPQTSPTLDSSTIETWRSQQPGGLSPSHRNVSPSDPGGIPHSGVHPEPGVMSPRLPGDLSTRRSAPELSDVTHMPESVPKGFRLSGGLEGEPHIHV